MRTVLEKLATLELFANVPSSEKEELSQCSEWVTFKKNQQLFEMGQDATHIFIVGYGVIKLVRPLSSGEEMTMSHMQRGQLIGALVAMSSQARYPARAVAMEDSGLIRVTATGFKNIIESNKSLGRMLMEQISCRMINLQTDKALSTSSVQKRIAEFLLRITKNEPDQATPIKLTRQEIANSVGTTVETVIRILSQWTALKILKTEDRRIFVLNPTGLAEIEERQE